jgi:nitric oxide reductase NorE protein
MKVPAPIMLSEKLAAPRLPGEVGIWFFVLGDMTVFAIFFCTFMFYRGPDAALFQKSQSTLNQNFGAINTILLLTSSALVVHAIRSLREDSGRRAPAIFASAFLCGCGFVAIKIVEYGEKISAHITPFTNDFFMFYFMLTGIHFLHVLLGLGMLGYLWVRSKRRLEGPGDLLIFESGATFWHMVDLLWIVLFPLLYLIK